MTATTRSTRQRPRAIPDLSYIKANPSYRDNPDYVLAALERGGLIACGKCKRIVGLGSSPEMAIDDGLRVGTAVRVGADILCTDHAREAA